MSDSLCVLGTMQYHFYFFVGAWFLLNVLQNMHIVYGSWLFFLTMSYSITSSLVTSTETWFINEEISCICFSIPPNSILSLHCVSMGDNHLHPNHHELLLEFYSKDFWINSGLIFKSYFFVKKCNSQLLHITIVLVFHRISFQRFLHINSS